MQFRNRCFPLCLFLSSVGQKTVLRFQHITRIYFSRLAKELLVILPVGLLVILLGNLIQPQSQFDTAKQNILTDPADPQPHLFLAQQFFVTNQFREAEIEVKSANNQDLLQQIQEIKNQPEEIRKKIFNLQKIVDQLPNYRDAYIELAILHWQLYRPFDARKYLEKALEIDPNNGVANKILEVVK